MGKDYERSDDGLPEGYVESESARIRRDQENADAEEARVSAEPTDGDG